MDAALALSRENQVKPMGVSHESIAMTLCHIYMADRIWYKRTVDPGLDMPPWNVNFPLDKLVVDWQDIQNRWEAWAESLPDDADLNRVIAFKRLNGDSAEAPLSQIVLHVVNHGTLHRGQVVAMLRQLGVKPPTTDFIGYVLELKAAAKAQ